MVDSDVESLLKNGYWPNSRAKSPDPRSIPDTSHKPSYLSQDDRAIPRKLPYHIGPRKPPPPIVEDENDALAKEAGSVVSSVASEEPTNRGDPDQYPILLPVDEHQHNPERRFILVPSASDSSSDVSGTEKKPSEYLRSAERAAGRAAELDTEPPFYEANTCRKYESPPERDGKASKKEIRPEAEHRRSRPGDLPPIITDGGSGDDSRRAKSTTRIDNRAEDYLSPRHSASSRTPRERLLTPEVIEHATNGRDRQYYRGGSSPEPQSRNRSAQPNDQYNRNSQHSHKSKEREHRSAHPSSPTLQKRRTSELPKYSRRGSEENYESSRQYVDRSSSKSDRKVPSSTYSQSDPDSGSQKSSSSRDARAPPQYSDTFYSSEDDSRQRADHRRMRSGMPAKHELPPIPVESRGTGRRKSRGQSSLPSPRLSQSSLSDPYSSSSSSRSATFPREPVPSRSEDRAGRNLPRASTSKGSFNATRNAVPTALSATTAMPPAPNASADHRRSPVRSVPKAGSVTDPRSQPSTPSVPTSARPSWPPPRYEPPQSSKSSDPPISSYRRFSTEVKTGDLPDIPHCPRTREEAGHMDWLTLPRCDSFNICPSCYSANFASTEFAHEFVLMPFRPRDRPLACDFGASEFYRIAWLFTRKYGRPDLGLFHGLTKIAATCQPCTGHRQVSRLWYSIRDPSTKRYIDEFTVCDACASTVETLLPSLTGLFVPLDSPAERTRGVCAMHHDRGYDRGRFLLYFDVLEAAADRALETQSAPNVQALADRIRQLAAIPPCPEGRTLYDTYWHTMREVPIVVCPECFMMVVQPLLDRRDDLTVAGNFHHELQYKKKAECMLYSDRMRSVFNRAVMKRDLGYLTEKINERTSKKEEFDARLKALQRQGPASPWAAAETDRIIKEWKRYE